MDERVWLGILEAERLYQYYHRLARKMHKRQVIWDFLLVAPAGGVAGTLVAQFLQGASQSVALLLLISVVGSIAMWQQQPGYAVKATAAGMISLQYHALGHEWRRLAYQAAPDETVLIVLKERLTSIASQHELPFDDEASREAEETADRVVLGEFSNAA